MFVSTLIASRSKTAQFGSGQSGQEVDTCGKVDDGQCAGGFEVAEGRTFLCPLVHLCS